MKFKDLTGDIIGNWKVLKRIYKNNNKVYWLCECQCELHTQKIIESYNLKHNKIKNCGCSPISKIRDDLCGRIFDCWVVIKRVENIGKQVAYLCECNCNVENKEQKVIMASKLKSHVFAKCKCNKNILDYCEVCGRKDEKVKYRESLNKTLCHKHYNQIKKYGKPLDTIQRTIYDKNEIEIYENHAEISLYNKDCEETGKAVIDIKNIDEIKKYKWYKHGGGYAIATIGDSKVLLHKVITDTTKEKLIDHENEDKLDCRKFNLRLADKSKNGQNRGIQKNNSSGFSGVNWNKNRNRWYAKLGLNNKIINLGSSINIEEAVLMRLEGEIKYYKEFRNPHNINQYIQQFGITNKLEKLLKQNNIDLNNIQDNN